MLELEITKEILTSFLGTLLALLSASLVWFLKSAYEKHRFEILALAKFERIFANNLVILKDNFDFLDEWITSLEQSRAFSFHFENYYINEEETYRLSNLELINSVLSINYKLRRTSLDFDNMYKSYWNAELKIDAIQDDTKKNNDLALFYQNIIGQLKKMKPNREFLKNDLINAVALIRANHKVRFHSLFGYVSLMFVDVFPRITNKSIEKEVLLLKDNIKRNEEAQK